MYTCTLTFLNNVHAFYTCDFIFRLFQLKSTVDAIQCVISLPLSVFLPLSPSLLSNITTLVQHIVNSSTLLLNSYNNTLASTASKQKGNCTFKLFLFTGSISRGRG